MTDIDRKTPGRSAQSFNKLDSSLNRSTPALSRSYLAISQPKYPHTSEPVTSEKAYTPLLHHKAKILVNKRAHRNVEPPVGAFNTRVRYSEYLATGSESNV